MAGFRVYYDWFAGTASNLLAAGIMEAEDPGLTDNWGKDKEPKEEDLPWFENPRYSDGRTSKARKNRLMKSNRELLKSMLTNSSEQTIIEASKSGHEEIVKVLMDNGVDVNTKDDYGFTPISYAALKGHDGIVDLLIENGADVDARNNWGGTALAQAVYFGHIEIAKTLIDHGADINVNIHGSSLVKFAAKNGHDDLLNHLYVNSEEELEDFNNNKIKNDKSDSPFKKWRNRLRNSE